MSVVELKKRRTLSLNRSRAAWPLSDDESMIIVMNGIKKQNNHKKWVDRGGPVIHAAAMDAELETGIIGAGYHCHIDDRPPPKTTKIGRLVGRFMTAFPFLQ